jgi:alpha-glucosidase (family GH31 glycosyl hydrolase)
VHLPAGLWFDVLRHRIVHGGVTLSGYHAGLSQTPMFIRLGTPTAAALTHSLGRTG